MKKSVKIGRLLTWLIFGVVLLVFAPQEIFAQKYVLKGKKQSAISKAPAIAAEIQEHKLQSGLMAREMPYRVLLPTMYAKTDKKYPVIYLLHGLTGHFDNWTDKTKLAEYLAAYNFIVVTPEGNDGWYTDSSSVPNDKYESYIIKELIPEIDKKFRTDATRESRVIAGLSMGGYGSIKFGLKYPEMFALVGSFSGAFGAPSLSVKTLGSGWKALTDSIAGVYGDDDSQTRKDNDIYRITREANPGKLKTLPFIYISCGTEDFLIQENRNFNSLIVEKKIPHEFRELPGVHDWKFWDAQIQEFLRVANRFVGAKAAVSAKAN